MLFGCGSEETPAPTEQPPNYFPDAIGTEWVYSEADGHHWTREVSGETDIDGKPYRVFTDTPRLTETFPDFLYSTYFRTTPNAVVFTVSEQITDYLEAELPKAVQDDFAGLELTVVLDPFAHPELVFFQTPLGPALQWDALNIKVNGNIVLQDLALLQIPFEAHITVKAEVVAESPLETPAGNFEKTYRIDYQTDVTHTLFSRVETIQLQQTLWFAPHVGIVKFGNGHDVTELIAYSFQGTTEE